MISYTESEAKEASLCCYYTDLHALEKYLLNAIENQLTLPDLGRFPQAEAMIERTAGVLRIHLQRLEAEIDLHHVESRAAVKDTMTAMAGFALGLVSKAREQHVAKMLRDDATLLTLAALGYTMLHTTALGLGHAEAATQALEHLEELTPLVLEMNRLLPATVAIDLKTAGFIVDPAAAEQAQINAKLAWRGLGVAAA